MSWTLHAIVEVADPSWESVCSWSFVGAGRGLAQAVEGSSDVTAGWPASETIGQAEARLIHDDIRDRAHCPGSVIARLIEAVGEKKITLMVRSFGMTVTLLCALYGRERVRVLFYET